MTWLEEEERRHRALVGQLTEEGLVDPLATDPSETRAWLDWELASLVEGRLHRRLEPSALSVAEREAWERRVTRRGRGLPSPHGGFQRAAWLLACGERVGTIALGTTPMGGGIPVSSLYVRPDRRGRGVASRALRRAFAAAVAQGCGGIRLDVDWSWQRAVRFYAHLGMWVHNWKHSLVLTWSEDLPPYRVELEGEQASFAVRTGDRWTVLLVAERRGEELAWYELPAYASLPWTWFELYIPARATFALHLALAGWPLVRSAADWARRRDSSDVGDPEGLAHKIEVFEAVSRRDGYDVRTPRIPGLRYRDLDDLES